MLTGKGSVSLATVVAFTIKDTHSCMYYIYITYTRVCVCLIVKKKPYIQECVKILGIFFLHFN